MKQNRPFWYLTLADLIARSAYQMGKTPLLPLFALQLGAADAFLGLIVAVSTLTGMLLKPFIGALSDSWGRRRWLLIGTSFFTLVPFVYHWVDTPTQLFWVRIVHGMATAIYGPVTLAYVSEQWPTARAERLGWFGAARSAGYMIGPALAGWLLLSLSPTAVFTLIGFISMAAFLPVLALPESVPVAAGQTAAASLPRQLYRALAAGSQTPAIWLAGGLEGGSYIVLYALKAFLPVYALSRGINLVVIGLFFTVQEGATLLLKPAGGWLADRWGYLSGIGLGMLLLGGALLLLDRVHGNSGLLLLATAVGAAQALIFPATTALAAAQLNGRHLGAGMGLLGTLQNSGKVLGPILGGLLIARFDFIPAFYILSGCLWLGAGLIGLRTAGWQWQRRQPANRLID